MVILAIGGALLRRFRIKDGLRTAAGVPDEQAEALTLNNLALALAQGGAQAEAVQHLEQALVLLHKLGDEEHEWRVLANLGIVHRRQGHSEEAVNLLHEALDRLPPESSAYHQVEEELRRANGRGRRACAPRHRACAASLWRRGLVVGQ